LFDFDLAFSVGARVACVSCSNPSSFLESSLDTFLNQYVELYSNTLGVLQDPAMPEHSFHFYASKLGGILA
jgi:hypothetical protein